jgi:sodium/potassium-transporting ATPase subunit alpha
MHQLPLPAFYQRLHADPVRGLSERESAQRLERDGLNVLVQRRRTPEILRFLQHLTKLFALLLWAGAALSFLAEWLMPGQGYLYIGSALAAVVVLNGAFSYYQEYKAEKIMAGFHSMLPAMARVLRAAGIATIPAAQLVRGDVVLLQEGDRVPADARLFEVFGLKVNNASLTGESEPQLRTTHPTDARLLDSRNLVFSGTNVEAGRGKAVVFATGMHTQIGRTAALTQSVVAQETPIRKELRRFSHIIAALAITMGVAVLVAELLWLESPFWSKLIFAIGIIVANVPEGLLATVTLCLAIAARHMAGRNALVKNLEAVETLGCTTVICTDKTGTLTQNRMRVTRLFLNECVHSEADAQQERAELDKLLMVATLCNNARLRAGNPADYSGDPTEGALLVYAQRYLDVQARQVACPRLFEQPFSSKTKHMITINQVGNQPVACLKGAPDVVFDHCDRILINGQSQALTAEHKTAYLNAYVEFARRAERVLLLAYRDVTPPHAPWGEDDVPQQGYIFAGLISLLDPPRPEVPQAVAAIRAAGIRVIMVTGDYQITAEAIGRQVGLITIPAPSVVTGDQLRTLSDAQLDWELEGREIIFARITPDQKLRIVQALQRHHEVVAMTGDGVNDAPALKQADIGVAMGHSGTDVAREAADMVLMDDNFATLAPAIREGRAIFDNLKKAIVYILTSNVPELAPFLAFILLGLPLALTVILILAIDLGTDMLPAIALGSERPEADVMQRPPRSRHTHLLNARLLFLSYGLLGMIESAAGFYAYFHVLYAGGWTWGQALAPDSLLYHQAIAAFFAAVILCQVANGLLSKTSRQSLWQQGLFSNRLLLWGIALELLLAYGIIQIDALHPFFGTASLSLPQLLLGLPFAVAMLIIDELRRVLIRRNVRWVTCLTAY